MTGSSTAPFPALLAVGRRKDGRCQCSCALESFVAYHVLFAVISLNFDFHSLNCRLVLIPQEGSPLLVKCQIFDFFELFFQALYFCLSHFFSS
jgi:hypothetical protein